MSSFPWVKRHATAFAAHRASKNSPVEPRVARLNGTSIVALRIAGESDRILISIATEGTCPTGVHVLICDAHTHFFSKTFFELLLAEASEASKEPIDALQGRVRQRAEIEIPDESPKGHAERWMRELSRNGVERAVTFASLPGEADAVLEGTRVTCGRLVPYLLCNPSTPAGLESATQSLRAGFRGVLLFPAMHHFDPNGSNLDGLYEEAAARRAPVVVHCGLLQIRLRDVLGIRPTYDLRYANPLNVGAAAERHPKTTFVLPHFGGGYFREALIVGAQSDNIRVDTSSSNSWIKTHPGDLTLAQVFDRALAVYGARRIDFGTDSSTFPRGWRNDLLTEQVAALEALGVSEVDKSRIFGENLIELLEGS